jgi:hypothetical protein
MDVVSYLVMIEVDVFFSAFDSNSPLRLGLFYTFSLNYVVVIALMLKLGSGAMKLFTAMAPTN